MKRPPAHRAEITLLQERKRPTHDGEQVGPGRGKPDRELELPARKSDKDLVSEFHQGQQANDLHQQAGYKTATSTGPVVQSYLTSGRRPYKRFLSTVKVQVSANCFSDS
jgi:hypothetical protein